MFYEYVPRSFPRKLFLNLDLNQINASDILDSGQYDDHGNYLEGHGNWEGDYFDQCTVKFYDNNGEEKPSFIWFEKENASLLDFVVVYEYILNY